MGKSTKHMPETTRLTGVSITGSFSKPKIRLLAGKQDIPGKRPFTYLGKSSGICRADSKAMVKRVLQRS